MTSWFKDTRAGVVTKTTTEVKQVEEMKLVDVKIVNDVIDKDFKQYDVITDEIINRYAHKDGGSLISWLGLIIALTVLGGVLFAVNNSSSVGSTQSNVSSYNNLTSMNIFTSVSELLPFLASIIALAPLIMFAGVMLWVMQLIGGNRYDL
jgi:hypothetical protein